MTKAEQTRLMTWRLKVVQRAGEGDISEFLRYAASPLTLGKDAPVPRPIE
jgi:hypothetical protein